MGTAAKKPRAMRSRRSGVKKLTLIKKNLELLKKLVVLLLPFVFKLLGWPGLNSVSMLDFGDTDLSGAGTVRSVV